IAASSRQLAEFNLYGDGVWPPLFMMSIGKPFGSTNLHDVLGDSAGVSFRFHEVDVELSVFGQASLLVCGDFDRDRDVDSADLNTLIANFTGAGVGDRAFHAGDCDLDRDVDVADLNELIMNWTGASASSPERMY